MDYFSISKLHVALGGCSILKGIDFEVKKGELVSLLGPSGCGKSTLLKTTAGLIAPEQGEIHINAIRVNNVPPEKRGAVIVFQDLRLFPHLNVAENIEFGLKMKGIQKEERCATVTRMLDKVGLSGYEKRKIHELSGGQQQRVALARALAGKPELLLLDEPFSSLDNHLRQKMRELVLALHRELNLTTVLVTHDQEEALMLSDRVAVMLNGQIVQFDTPKNIYEFPSSPEVADYFGDMNYIEGTVKNGCFTGPAPLLPERLEVPLEDGDYLLMIKPHLIRLRKEPGPWNVTSVGYLGGRSQLRVSCDRTALRFVSNGDIGITAGDAVAIDIDYRKGIFYKK
ncbi:iron(III) transport system ATP-binding protein [Sporobacter termitidis DSM 10068]|uniref:ABC-type quaternary amine transporter n=1 Tax=Sporobacter termitidis DSM 10068 TaxID=1123282 RepID=A0A1M5URQ7_9FIRM|nr:ABC transporter ATP-binding protein [Sporobacter termitidis]SHH65651.1 iron(III) transport system ATP-binding protein [Sporobacter termitidis DSM 10068]